MALKSGVVRSDGFTSTGRSGSGRRALSALAMQAFLLSGSLAAADTGGAREAYGSSGQAQAIFGAGRSDQALLDGDRVVIGTVTDIKGGQIQVQTGESLQPRYLPQTLAEEKRLVLKKGDRVRMVLNEQQLLVDFHPLGQGEGRHTVLKGMIAEQMKVGQERIVIQPDGQEARTYLVRPLIRSKLAAMPVGAASVFLLDESNQIVDVTFGSRQAVELAAQEYGRMAKPKSSHLRVDGMIVKEVAGGQVTVKTSEGKEQTFAVRPYAAQELSQSRKGDSVTLLLDDSNHVSDVARPNKPQSHR